MCAPNRPRRGLAWPVVAGLGSLGLLWPVLRLAGFESVAGGFGTALAAYGATLVVWVAVAGLGGVPRPVATLALAGVVHGALLGTCTVVLDLGHVDRFGEGALVLVVEVGRSAGLGALAGLLAEQVQARRRG
ncbi:hypothetical protein L615_008600000140 [Nocardioides sp. J9]|uniref:hypothetical protein n=1 Tax=unclassified Nocardioides TaxID=2615069 RepID=UPI0004907BE1|nr:MULTISPECIES: hypothetical protein [unclassified Nocardioides]TWG90947.1 hypothetical protein L615_008600000140 [Nocardioides sp. J9]